MLPISFVYFLQCSTKFPIQWHQPKDTSNFRVTKGTPGVYPNIGKPAPNIENYTFGIKKKKRNIESQIIYIRDTLKLAFMKAITSHRLENGLSSNSQVVFMLNLIKITFVTGFQPPFCDDFFPTTKLKLILKYLSNVLNVKSNEKFQRTLCCYEFSTTELTTTAPNQQYILKMKVLF